MVALDNEFVASTSIDVALVVDSRVVNVVTKVVDEILVVS